MSFEALAVSTTVVALGEIGDKTQLLALLLAARYRRPMPIILGILVATLANHAGASALGDWLTRVIDPNWMRWILGASFLAVAAWMLVPDEADELDEQPSSRWGVFGVTVVAFFLAEMGDKTQIATVMLAAKYHSLVTVTTGTTLGMVISNVPAVLLGDRATRFVPMHWVHRIAAAVFAVLGIALLLGLGMGSTPI
jgi:putative Ca2+/H+ antiporter (TMEM165/GDT1 family)